MPDELGGAVFSMQEGELDGPIRTDFGFHIVRLDDILERGPLPMDQVRGELLAELRDREAESAFRDKEKELSDALFDADDMQAIAAATGLEVQTIAGYPRSGAEPFGDNQAVVEAIYDDMVLNDGQISELVEVDANSSAVFRVTRYNEPTRQPLDDVREEIRATLLSQEAQLLLVERTSQVLEAVEAGEEFAIAAEAAGATVSEPTRITRQQEDIDPAVLFQVFAARKPGDEPVTGSIRNSENGYTLYSLQDVIPGRPESVPLAQRDQGKLQLSQESGLGDYRAFVQALYDDADVIINDDIVAGQDLF